VSLAEERQHTKKNGRRITDVDASLGAKDKKTSRADKKEELLRACLANVALFDANGRAPKGFSPHNAPVLNEGGTQEAAYPLHGGKPGLQGKGHSCV